MRDTNIGLLGAVQHDLSDAAKRRGNVAEDLVVLNPNNGQVVALLRPDAVLLDASQSTVVWFDQDCESSCEHVSRFLDGKLTDVKLDRGQIAGAGSLSADAHYFATAVQGSSGTAELRKFDLNSGQSVSLGPYISAHTGGLGLLSEDIPSIWSGDTFVWISGDGTRVSISAGLGAVRAVATRSSQDRLAVLAWTDPSRQE